MTSPVFGTQVGSSVLLQAGSSNLTLNYSTENGGYETIPTHPSKYLQVLLIP